MLPRALFILALFAFGAPSIRGSCTGNAKYLVFNECNWTSASHPTDYPSNAHFSPLCGTAHNAGYTLFQRGGISTPGVKDVAELGEHGVLANEIAACSQAGNCGGFVSFSCDTSANPPGVGDGVCNHVGTVTVSRDYPYVSLMSMIAPSPDWFVGINSVNLCKKSSSTGAYYWMNSYPATGSRSLLAYDAGTDIGPSFASPDAPISPFDPILVFDGKDASNIFYNQADRVLNPLCRIVLKKV